jgi:hypothetical protein
VAEASDQLSDVKLDGWDNVSGEAIAATVTVGVATVTVSNVPKDGVGGTSSMWGGSLAWAVISPATSAVSVQTAIPEKRMNLISRTHTNESTYLLLIH